METVKYLFQSLYKNQAIIDGRRKPWWIAIIVFFLSVFFLMIPPLSQGYLTAGSAAIGPTVENGVRMGLDKLSDARNTDYQDFQNLVFAREGERAVLRGADGTPFEQTPFYRDTNIDSTALLDPNANSKYFFSKTGKTPTTTTNPDGSTSTNLGEDETWIYLSVYSTDRDLMTQAGRDWLVGTLAQINNQTNERGTAYHSFLLFGNDSFLLSLYNDAPVDVNAIASGTAAAPAMTGSISGSYAGLLPLIDRNGGTYSLKVDAAGGSYTSADSPSSTVWTDFFNYAYQPIRDANTWTMTGIMGGAGAGLILLGGLILWLFTLAKKNLLHKDCTVWEGLQMSMMANFSVAVVTMIAYFFGMQIGLTVGILLYVMRLSFLVMRTTGRYRDREKDSKPLYQARS